MAGARIERVGSIFKRVEGLYKGNVLTKEELPIWYDVCKAFPPKREPELSRPLPDQTVKNLIYVEDHIRGHFIKTYEEQTKEQVSLQNPKTVDNSVMEKFVQTFMAAAKKDDGKSADEILSDVEKSMLAQHFTLQRKSVKN